MIRLFIAIALALVLTGCPEPNPHAPNRNEFIWDRSDTKRARAECARIGGQFIVSSGKPSWSCIEPMPAKGVE